MRIPKVDPDLCTGCAACSDICPEVFGMGDDDLAKVINQQGAGEAKVQEAIDGCPSEAISWIES
jgi:ferredoxin